MRIARNVSGDLVFRTLQQFPSGLTKQQLIEMCGLSPSQVSTALTWIREEKAAEAQTPLIWTHDHGYQLAPGLEAVEPYANRQFQAKYNGVRRLLKAVIGPQSVLTPDNDWCQRARVSIEMACDYLAKAQSMSGDDTGTLATV